MGLYNPIKRIKTEKPLSQNWTNKRMNKKEFEAKQFADFKDQFQWFLGAGLLLLFLDVFLLDRKTSWLKKLNLFNEN